MPPPFYPSSKTDAQTPPTDDGDTGQAPTHYPQPKAGVPAFTALESSPATPVTPQEREQDVHELQFVVAHPPPGFAPPPGGRGYPPR